MQRFATRSVGGTLLAGKRTFAWTTALLGKVIPYKLTDIGEGIQQVEVLEVAIKEGDTIAEFDKICQVQSDKATVDITSRFPGVVKKLHISKGSTAFVGAAMLDIEVEEERAAATSGGAPQAAAESTKPAGGGAAPNAPATPKMRGGVVLASPAVRRAAAEFRVDLMQVSPSGKNGQVTKEDVMAFVNSTKSATGAGASAPAAAASRAPISVAEDEVIPLTGIRKSMVQNMTKANDIPALGTAEEIDMGPVTLLRKELQSVLDRRNIKNKLSFMPFFIKAASVALLQHPELNAVVNDDCSVLTVRKQHNIGFAMDAPGGLIVPVLKNVQQKSILDIALEMAEMIEQGKRGALQVDQLRDGTFTISNVGNIGSTFSIPVILPPQVVIGALGRVQKLPRFDKDGTVYEANVVNAVWSADHRVVAGATMVRFSVLLKQYMENPAWMLLDTR